MMTKRLVNSVNVTIQRLSSCTTSTAIVGTVIPLPNSSSSSSSKFCIVGRQKYLQVQGTTTTLLTDYRHFSSSSSSSSSSSRSTRSSSPNEWRKRQLDKLENKFKNHDEADRDVDIDTDTVQSTTDATTMREVQSEDELQPMWKEMEGRVVRRKPRTIVESGGKTGRMNIRKTDEEVWLQEGLYDDDEEVDKDDSPSSLEGINR
jgi:hypothetical protein